MKTDVPPACSTSTLSNLASPQPRPATWRASSRRLSGRTGRLYARPISPIVVVKIQFGSPGFVDLAGVGRVVGEVRKFLLGIIDRFIGKEDREIARASATQDVIAKKIKNADSLLKLADKAGLDAESQQALLREVLTADRYIEGKLLSQQIKAVK